VPGTFPANHRPDHDDIALRIAPERKDVVAHLHEPEFPVERHGPRVALPDTEPHHVRPPFPELVDARLHQSLRNAFAMPFLGNVKTLDLARTPRGNAIRRRAPAHLGIGDQAAVSFAHQRDHAGVRDLGRLHPLAVTALAMELHVLDRVHGAERRPESSLGQPGQLPGVTSASFAQHRHQRSGQIRKVRHGGESHDTQDRQGHPTCQQSPLFPGRLALRHMVGRLLLQRLHYRFDPLETFRLCDRARFDLASDPLHFRERGALPLKVV
jgi:hypothetical protein